MFSLLGMDTIIMINGLTFLFSALLIMKIKTTEEESKESNSLMKRTSLKEFFSEFLVGLKLIFLNRLMFHLLLITLILNTIVAPLEMLLSIWAKDVLKVRSSGFGIMLTSVILGSLLGRIVVQIPIIKRTNETIAIDTGVILFGGILLAVSMADQSFYLCTVLLLLGGIVLSVVSIKFSTILMQMIDRNHMGKVQGTIQTLNRGGQPLGITIAIALLAILKPKMLLAAIGLFILLGGIYSLFALLPLQAKQCSQMNQSKSL